MASRTKEEGENIREIALIREIETNIDDVFSKMKEKKLELAQTEATLFAHDVVYELTSESTRDRIEERVNRLKDKIKEEESAVKRAQKNLDALMSELDSVRKRFLKDFIDGHAFHFEHRAELRTHFMPDMESFEPFPEIDLRDYPRPRGSDYYQ